MYKGRETFNFCAALSLAPAAVAICTVAAFTRAAMTQPPKNSNKKLFGYRFFSNLFFTQQRVGEDGELFTIYKIKTARDEEYPGQPFNDRIDPVGRIIRKLKIDELPQIINVLRGDMSIVGPRPVIQEDPEASFMLRNAYKPGIFSTATALGLRNRNDFETEKDLDDHLTTLMRHDWIDARDASLKNDLKILCLHALNAKTIFKAPDHRDVEDLTNSPDV